MMMTPFLFNVSHYDMGYVIPLSLFREGVYVSFIKIFQNTPQLCWGDEWPTLSHQRLCRNVVLRR